MQTGTVKACINVPLKMIPRTKKGHNFNIPMVHGFRKYFNVTMKTRKDCNLSLCEKMIGHSTTIPMDNHYGTFTEEMLFEEYKKAIPELTISPEERQRVQLDEKNKKLDELESKQAELQKSNARIDELEKRFDNELTSDKKVKEEQDEMNQIINDPVKLSEFLRKLESNMKKEKNPKFKKIKK